MVKVATKSVWPCAQRLALRVRVAFCKPEVREGEKARCLPLALFSELGKHPFSQRVSLLATPLGIRARISSTSMNASG